MFGLGIIEGLIIVLLLSWLFREKIARRWPKLGRSLRSILLFTLAGILLFDLITWLN